MTGGTIKSKLSFASAEEENLKKTAEQIAEYDGKTQIRHEQTGKKLKIILLSVRAEVREIR